MRKKVVILSTSLFTDRVLLYSSFFESNLEHYDIEVWTSSFPINKEVFLSHNVVIKIFPKIKNFKERLNFLRRINNLSWSYKLKATSFLSMKNFNFKHYDLQNKLKDILDVFLAKFINFLGLENVLETYLLNKLSTQSRSIEALQRFQENKPDLLVVMNPFWTHESAVAIEAKKIGIKIYSFIPSWDNITTKTRFVFKSDYYAVWSEIRKKELQKYYPYTSNQQIECVGAPQYDVFFNEKYNESKTDFLNRNGLNDDKPIILYALGSPNFIKSEVQTCIDVIDYFIKTGMINQIQVLVRPHPNKDNSELKEILFNKHKNVKIQTFKTSGLVTELRTQTEDQIIDWISTFKYSDLLINLSSTAIFDALYFKKPVLNINFDHTKDKIFDEFIKEVNLKWIHLRTIYEANVIYYVDDVSSIKNKISEFLEGKLESNGKKILDEICSNRDGKSGKKLAQSIFSKLN